MIRSNFILNHRKSLMALLVLILCICAGVGYNQYRLYRRVRKPQHTDVHYDGIDVSHHQGKIDWVALSKDSCITYVYIKATEGSSIQDKRFERNIREAQRNGIKVGAYHLLSIRTTPEKQFQNFKALVPNGSTDLIPALDIEEAQFHKAPAKKVIEYAKRIADLMENYYGRKPLIYTSRGVYNKYLSTTFSSYMLWISAYSKRCPILKGDTHANIWQYSEHGNIEGHETDLDLNCLVNGTELEDLELE